MMHNLLKIRSRQSPALEQAIDIAVERAAEELREAMKLDG
jgi:hypothetical protein